MTIKKTSPFVAPNFKAPFSVWRELGILFGILLLSATVALGQSFTITPSTVSASADVDINPGLLQILGNSLIYNQTDQNLNMKWERIVNDKPECWSSSVDSPNFQSFPGVDEFEFTLLPNLPDGGDLIVHMYIEGFSGEGQVVLRVSNLDIPADTVLITYNFTATGNNPCIPSSISEIQKTDSHVYPNPCTDAFQLKNSNQVYQLNIYNMLGVKVQTFYTTPGKSFSVAAFPKGVYVVEMINAKGTLLKTTKLVMQ